MHVAPPVRMNWAQDRSWRVFVTFCACAAAANAAAWAATHWQAANLTAAMEKAHAEKKLTRKAPSAADVQKWIDQASTMEPTITH